LTELSKTINRDAIQGAAEEEKAMAQAKGKTKENIRLRRTRSAA
jgi:hypothetical protein